MCAYAQAKSLTYVKRYAFMCFYGILAEASVLAAAAVEASKKSKFDFTVVKTRREIEMDAVNAAFTEAGACYRNSLVIYAGIFLKVCSWLHCCKREVRRALGVTPARSRWRLASMLMAAPVLFAHAASQ